MSHDSDTEVDVDETNYILFRNINYENNYHSLRPTILLSPGDNNLQFVW